MRKEQHTEKAYVAVSENSCSVFIGDDCILHAETYRNPYHLKNLYLKIKFLSDEPDCENPFALIKEHFNCPLQVMLYSNDPLARDLISYGFRLRRRCFERKVCKDDLIAEPTAGEADLCSDGSNEYTACCKLLFECYQKNHARINEFTAGYDVFCEKLPKKVMYRKSNDSICDCAFVEGGEIAYAASAEPKDFSDFARTLVCKMFETHKTLCFEADDCDPAAMKINDLFGKDGKPTYNTYILD